MKTEFGSWVVDLSETSVKSGSWGSVDDSSEFLFSHDVPGSSGAAVGSVHVDFHDEVPIKVFHFLEWDVSENTGIVDQNVDFSEIVNCSFDNFFSELDWIVISDCDSSFALDLFYDFIGSISGVTGSWNCWTQVIDDDFSSSGGIEESVFPSESSSSTCNNDYFIVESETHIQIILKIDCKIMTEYDIIQDK